MCLASPGFYRLLNQVFEVNTGPEGNGPGSGGTLLEHQLRGVAAQGNRDGAEKPGLRQLSSWAWMSGLLCSVGHAG